MPSYTLVTQVPRDVDLRNGNRATGFLRSSGGRSTGVTLARGGEHFEAVAHPVVAGVGCSSTPRAEAGIQVDVTTYPRPVVTFDPVDVGCLPAPATTLGIRDPIRA